MTSRHDAGDRRAGRLAAFAAFLRRTDGVPVSVLRVGLFVREFALVAVLFSGYRLGRVWARGEAGDALGHASQVWSFERAVHLPSELAVQHLLLRSGGLVSAANSYYAWVHFPITGLFLVWLWWRDREAYGPIRRILVVMTGIALVIHTTYPLAPPRMMTALGFVDTGRVFGPYVYAKTDMVANQYAAMPSLHVGWALVVALGVITVMRTRWRWLALLHPTITVLVVVGTANHYWLDGIVGGLLIIPGAFAARWRPRAGLLAGPLTGSGVPALTNAGAGRASGKGTSHRAGD
jgi:PAP2 superfamily